MFDRPSTTMDPQIVLERLLHDYNWATLEGKEALKPKITALLESGAPLTDKRKEKLQYVKDDTFLLEIMLLKDDDCQAAVTGRHRGESPC